jgi:hypothetical protein
MDDDNNNNNKSLKQTSRNEELGCCNWTSHGFSPKALLLAIVGFSSLKIWIYCGENLENNNLVIAMHLDIKQKRSRLSFNINGADQVPLL